MASKESQQHAKSKEELAKEKKLKKEKKREKREARKNPLPITKLPATAGDAAQHPSTSVTTASVDKDVTIAAETLAKLRSEMEKQRDEQRMVQLLKRKDDLNKLVAAGKLTQEQADADIEKEIKKLDEKKEGEQPHLLVGKDNLPTNRGQQWTSRNPYELSDSDVEEVGQQSMNFKPEFMSIRIDRNLVIEVEEINLGGRQGYNNGSYIGWSLKKIPAKENSDDDKEKEKKRPFNFSGSLKCLPEFHRGLRRLEESGVAVELPEAFDLLEEWKQSCPQDGRLDLSSYGQDKYTRKAFSFQDFRLYVDDVLFRSGTSGGLINYETICLTKKKASDKQKKIIPR